jgi:anti-sigma regulatory factor (Ser/Thr protein kinase)
MEIAVAESIRIKIDEGSKTAAARRIARHMAVTIGLGDTVAEKVAIVVTEMCTNLLNHAGGGDLLVHANTEENEPALEVLALDHGPGIADLDQCMRDGYSTGGTPGTGLGALVRQSKESDVFSIPGKGTAVLGRWRVDSQNPRSPLDSPLWQVGAVNIAKPGQEVCGDSWGCLQLGDHVVALVADGLGHGLEAKIASAEAVRMLHQNPNLGPKQLLERCDQALRSSRGAAVAVAQIDRERRIVTYAGVGNISGRIFSAGKSSHHMVSVNGTSGHRSDTLREFTYLWPDDGILLMCSDGIATGAGLEPYPRLPLCDPTLIAGVLYRDFERGHDDATVVVARAA